MQGRLRLGQMDSVKVALGNIRDDCEYFMTMHKELEGVESSGAYVVSQNDA